MIRRILVANLLFTFVLLTNVCVASNYRIPIDQVPEYGGMDRKSVPELAEGDKKFIEGVSKELGSRNKASKVFSSKGRRLCQLGKDTEAMKRLNQAWLLNPKNYESYWGFGCVIFARNEYSNARKWLRKAYSLKKNNPELNADLAYVYAVIGRNANSAKQKKNNFAKSNNLFSQFEKTNGNHPYLYYTWARSLAMQNKAKASYRKLNKYRKLGGTINTADLDAWLKQKLR